MSSSYPHSTTEGNSKVSTSAAITENTYVFSLGAHTLSVPMDIHAENRMRLVSAFWEKHGPSVKGSFVLLAGGRSKDGLWYTSDVGEPFRQESFFHWTFGVMEPDWMGGLSFDTGKSYLFMPKPDANVAVLDGKLLWPEEYRKRYGVDEVLFLDDIVALLGDLMPSRLLTLRGQDSYSRAWTREADFRGMSSFNVDNRLLYPIMVDCRVRKSGAEVECLRFAAKVSSDALVEVMKNARPGMMEYHLEAIFRHYVHYYGGMRRTASTCVSASGPNGAVLRYGQSKTPNDRLIRDGDMCMLDMGGEYYGYASDIALTFPINGIFTEDQKAVYNAVLRASRAVIAALRPGVAFIDMHLLAERTILEDLEKLGLLAGEVEEMLNMNIAAVFMPHGIGHLIGLDVHDVGGYTDQTPPLPERDADFPLKNFGINALRTCRILEAGVALTVEAGVYFIDSLLDHVTDPEDSRSKFFVNEVLQRFRGFGGVRIEDDVVITEEGCEVLSASIPRNVADIEAVMAEGRKLTVSLPEPLCAAGAYTNSPTNQLTSS